jgi:hypothetical protein
MSRKSKRKKGPKQLFWSKNIDYASYAKETNNNNNNNNWINLHG